MFCEFYKEKLPTDVCIFFNLGFDYSCINKKCSSKQCPWVGRPVNRPLGYYLKDVETALAEIKDLNPCQ